MKPLQRRQFLTGALVAAAGAAASPGLAFARAGGRSFTWPLGVQLWSVSAEMDRDFAGTLRKVGKLGYRQCEGAGLHGHTPEQFRRAVEAAGMRCDSTHFSMPDIQKDLPGTISTARDMGVKWLICSSPKPDRPIPTNMPWIPAITRAMTLDAWKKNVEWMNRIGHSARQAGLGFGYHNHPVDFGVYDGVRAYDLILKDTDPDLVRLELDVAWAVAGGADPVHLLRTYPRRFIFLHVKGLLHRPPPGQMGTDFSTTEIGRGVIDWRPVFAAARDAGVRGCFVEQEPPHRRPILQSLAMCRDYLENL